MIKSDHAGGMDQRLSCFCCLRLPQLGIASCMRCPGRLLGCASTRAHMRTHLYDMFIIKCLALHQSGRGCAGKAAGSELAVAVPAQAVASAIISADDCVCQAGCCPAAPQPLQGGNDAWLADCGHCASLAMPTPAPSKDLASLRHCHRVACTTSHMPALHLCITLSSSVCRVEFRWWTRHMQAQQAVS